MKKYILKQNIKKWKPEIKSIYFQTQTTQNNKKWKS